MNKNLDIQVKKYRPEIDGLRAIAVLAVIINHLNKDLLPSGYLGVDIFFVISGYVITSSLAKNKYIKFHEFILGFYSRRIKRILPSLALYVIAISITAALFNPKPFQMLIYAERALLGISNITFFKTSTDYFSDTTSLNPFTQTWSLGVEGQFYFFYPIFFWFTGYAKKKFNSINNFYYLLIASFVISLAGFIGIYNINFPAAYFLTPFRFWEIAVGGLVYISIKKNMKIVVLSKIISKEFLLCLTIIYFFLPQSQGLLATLLVVFTTSILLTSIPINSITYKLLTNKILNYLGLISYPLYLWHWGCLVIGRWIAGDSFFVSIISIIISFLLASLNYHILDNSLRRFNFDFKNLPSILFTLIYFLCIIFPKQFFFLGQYKEGFYLKIFKYGNLISPWQNPYYEFKPTLYFQNCEEESDLPKISNLKCEIINPAANKNIFLIGDSHVDNHKKSILSAIKKDNLSKVYKSITKLSGNILAGKTKNFWQNIREKTSQDEFEEELKRLYLKLNIGDLIIFSIERDDLITIRTKMENLPRETDYFLLSVLEQQLKRLIDLVQLKKGYLLLVNDIPKPCKNSEYFLINVVKKGNLSFCNVSKEESLKDRNPITLLYKKLALKKQVLYVDFHDKLCPDDICGVSVPNSKNNLLYRDSSPHFYPRNSEILSDNWYQIFLKIIN